MWSSPLQTPIAAIPERSGITAAIFESEIRPQYQPVVLRGLVSTWPAVQRNTGDRSRLVSYLRELDAGLPVYTVVAQPDERGRFYYGKDLRGTNFGKVASPLASTLDHLLRLEHAPRPPSIAVQAASVNQALPGFTRDNTMPLLEPGIEPTFWLGNRALVAPHFDVNDNIACVVAGRRKFTLFPPEQIENLYVGPILDAPGGVPISRVDIREPDLEQFPRYRMAQASAMEAVLEPGDALYIPAPWWHAVESLDGINLLVNYWFSGVGASGISPKLSLLYGLLSLAELPGAQRKAWGSFFQYYLFSDSSPSSDWPAGVNDIVTRMTAEQKQALIEMLRDSLKG
jgi:hypothetical protein